MKKLLITLLLIGALLPAASKTDQFNLSYWLIKNHQNISTSASPTFAGLTLSGLTASTVVYSNASKALTSLANGAGYLLNDGSGGLSWAAVSLAGYLKADRSVALTGVTGPAALIIDADEKFATVVNAAGFLTNDGSGAMTYTATVPATSGGTGQSSYAVGDMLYASGAGALSKLAAVATGQVLTSAGTTTAPAWSASPTLTGNLAASNLTASETLGAELITFDGSAGTGTNFTWDAGFTWGSGKFTHNAGSGVVALTTVWIPTAGTKYKVIITSTDAGTGDLTPAMGGITQPNITTSTTTTFYIKGSATALTLTPTNTNWTGTITGISIMAVTNSELTGSSLTINGGQTLLPIGMATYPTIASTVNTDLGFNLTNTQGQFIVDGALIGNFSSTGMQMTNTNQSYTIGGGSSIVGLASDGGYAKIYSANNILRLGIAGSPTGDQTLQSTASTGTNQNGSVLTIQGGQSTGTGTEGTIIFQTSGSAVASGSSANTYATRTTIGTYGINTPQALLINMTADAVLQVGMVAMVDAGTDERFDVNGVNNESPIGIVTGNGPTAQGTAYGLATAGIAYVAPAEDVVSVTRGYVAFQDASDAGYVDFGANVSASRHDYEIGHPIISEAAIAFDGAADVDPTANTIVLDSTPTWVVGDPVIFWDSGDTQPEGMVTGNVYWIKTIATATVTLSATRGGATLDITADGSGTTMYLMRLPKCMIHWN